MEKYYRPGEAAKRLAITPGYLAQLARENKIQASHLTPKGHRRYTEDDLIQAQNTLQGIISDPDAEAIVMQQAGETSEEEVHKELDEDQELSSLSISFGQMLLFTAPFSLLMGVVYFLMSDDGKKILHSPQVQSAMNMMEFPFLIICIIIVSHAISSFIRDVVREEINKNS